MQKKRHELRSEETKQGILSAARRLFAERGYDAVTMREIARNARCSHTTIYIYFKDKEALLQELSMPPLLELKKQMESILLQSRLSNEERLKEISQEFIKFCLLNKNMYTIFFVTKATRVDGNEPVSEINKLRIALFELISRGLREGLHLEKNDHRILKYSRIFFFTLQGIVGTYITSEEPIEALMERLHSTFDEAVEVLLLGFRKKMESEAG